VTAYSPLPMIVAAKIVFTAELRDQRYASPTFDVAHNSQWTD
jgi:hypothetical protein